MPRLASLLSPLICALVVSLVIAVPGFAQEATHETPAHISLVEGTAALERDGQTDTSPTSMPLLAGDRLRTQAGRVEVLFGDGSTLHLDANTIVDFQSDEVVRLLEGRVRLNIPGPTRAIAYRIDAPGAWVEVRAPGEYRIALAGADRTEVELAVIRGAADLVNEGGATELRAGERAYANAGAAPSQPYVYNSAAWDAFDRWSEARRDQRLGISAQYLPSEVRPYAASLDHYGSWRHEPSYGYVWYPRVSSGWRPYYYGRWRHLRPYGWTWIGHDPWAWPTHHYGRWGFSAGVWFWIPGRHWGPAWVSWAYAPGYVSWCPLGFNNRPLFSFVNINVFGGRRFTPWHGWTVVPHRRFGGGIVNVNVVNVTRIDARTRGAFAVRGAAPAYTGPAVRRARAPIRAAGTRITGVAVPRGGSPSIASPSDTRSRQAIRRRPGTGDSRTGPGYPAPAREPRPSAVAPSRGRAGAAVPRGAQPGSPDPATGGRRAVPRSAPRAGSPAATPAPERGTPSQRAAPRRDGAVQPAARGSDGGAAASPGRRPSRAVPRAGAPAPAPRGAVPARRGAPRGGGGGESTGPARESRSRAMPVPRAGRPAPSAGAPARSARPSDRPAPSPGMSAPPRRAPSAGRAAEPSGSPGRSVGRSAPPAYRAPSPAPRRGAPAGPPGGAAGPASRSRRAPAAARPAPGPGPQRGAARPARGSSGGGGGGSASAPRSRPRGGQQSSGPARRRGGN